MTELIVNGYTIEVRTARNIRNMSLRMALGKGIWVNVPYGVTKSQVVEFVNKHADWIEANYNKFASIKEALNHSVGDTIECRFHTIKLCEHNGAEFAHRKSGNEFLFYVPKSTKQDILNEIVDGFVVDVLRYECKMYLPKRVKDLAERFGFKYGKLSFRNNSTNWGSCSGTNNISLNVKLMKASDQVIDYVILHELCHTVVKNHSDEFWSLMAKVCPNYLALRKELKSVK